MREDRSGAWTLLTFSPPLQAKPSEMSDLIELHLLGRFFDFSMVMLSILPCPSARQPQDPIFSSCSPVRHPCIINYLHLSSFTLLAAPSLLVSLLHPADYVTGGRGGQFQPVFSRALTPR